MAYLCRERSYGARGETIAFHGCLEYSKQEGTDGETTPLAGVTYELVTGGGQPYFVTDSNLPDSSLTETQTPGWGGFYEVPAGMVEVRIGGTANNCKPTFAWEGSAPDQIRMPVRVGVQTQAFFVCQ